MKKFRHLLSLSVSLTLLVSCGAEITTFKAVTAGLSAASYGVFSSPDVNLKEKNYAAADFLYTFLKDKVQHNDVILAQPLEEVDHAGITSPLGHSIPEGVGLRFIELGHNVQLHDVAMAGNEGLYPVPAQGSHADFTLKGTYSVQKKHVDVYLRVIDMKSRQVVARFDYQLLLSKEVKELAQTQTRIFRVTQ